MIGTVRYRYANNFSENAQHKVQQRKSTVLEFLVSQIFLYFATGNRLLSAETPSVTFETKNTNIKQPTTLYLQKDAIIQ